MTLADEAGQGVALCQDILRAVAARDDADVLRLVNTADHRILRWAMATMTRPLWSLALSAARGDEELAARVLVAAANDPSDVVLTQVEVILDEALRGGLDG